MRKEAILIYQICRQHNIRLTVEWVNRDENEKADELSRLEYQDDYMLDPSCFQMVDHLWGPHTVDCFASEKKSNSHGSSVVI